MAGMDDTHADIVVIAAQLPAMASTICVDTREVPAKGMQLSGSTAVGTPSLDLRDCRSVSEASGHDRILTACQLLE